MRDIVGITVPTKQVVIPRVQPVEAYIMVTATGSTTLPTAQRVYIFIQARGAGAQMDSIVHRGSIMLIGIAAPTIETAVIPVIGIILIVIIM